MIRLSSRPSIRALCRCRRANRTVSSSVRFAPSGDRCLLPSPASSRLGSGLVGATDRKHSASQSAAEQNRWKHSTWQNVADQNRSNSSAAVEVGHIEDESEEPIIGSQVKKNASEIQRLKHIRNVGIFAHVDAGKTTVTERMLALAGVIRRAGNVDDGNTVTDYLPAERERGITIQSAAISFEWGWHNNRRGDDYEANDNVTISLIDTPGHIDFSVEVSRSVAVLDGAVLVVDAVAGVQAQTETVWRAMTRPTLNNHEVTTAEAVPRLQAHSHEPLPCFALVNKMDREGNNFWRAVKSLREKLPGANPVPIQIPLFRSSLTRTPSKLFGQNNIVAVSEEDTMADVAEFAGVVDLIHMRAILWPDLAATNGVAANVEDCVPIVIPLLKPQTHEPLDQDCQVTKQALAARYELVESLAEVDEKIEAYYLNEQEPNNAELRVGLRRATISQRLLPVMISSALRGLGVEPVLDAIADLLPSPLDRMAPAVNSFTQEDAQGNGLTNLPCHNNNSLGHPLNSSLLALAFKVVHMKGRGGSGDGRVVFARVYSGELRDRDTVQVISPPAPGEMPEQPRMERIGGMLELAGGRFANLQDGICKSGNVCALVGLKSVVTGDTLMITSSEGEKPRKGKKKSGEVVCLAGVSSPKPVLTVRVESETTEQQARLSEALALLAIEDPSLVVEETESTTLLSGLGELHIEVTLDRLKREYGLPVMVGPPSVAYRETITGTIETTGLVTYDRSIGGNRLQGSVHLLLEPTWCSESSNVACMMLADPVVTVGEQARKFLGAQPDDSEDDLVLRSGVFRALVQGCQGALKRGPLGPYALANVKCHVVDVDGEDGLAGFQAFPGALRAAASNAVARLLLENRDFCSVLEPSMRIEVNVPNDMVGTVLSDLTSRRGTVGDVVVGDGGSFLQNAQIRGDVPLVEILGYANSLRSITGGEGAFTAEYKGHSPTLASSS